MIFRGIGGWADFFFWGNGGGEGCSRLGVGLLLMGSDPISVLYKFSARVLITSLFHESHIFFCYSTSFI